MTVVILAVDAVVVLAVVAVVILTVVVFVTLAVVIAILFSVVPPCSFQNWYQFTRLVEFISRVEDVVSLKLSDFYPLHHLSACRVILKDMYYFHFKTNSLFIAPMDSIHMFSEDTLFSGLRIVGMIILEMTL